MAGDRRTLSPLRAVGRRAVILSFLAWSIAAAASLPLAVLSLEVLAGLARTVPARFAASGCTIAVLIPAHNEAEGLAATLEALKPVVPAGTRILVVADNCDDETAQVAREAGVEVIERHDLSRRGKGYALAFGRDHLAATGPPEVTVILDADCRMTPGSLEALASAAQARRLPAQAINLIAADLAADPIVQISSFAMLVKNSIRSRGMQRLGGAALLTGTGMAFPWPLLARARLASGSIVEDLALGVEMTCAGYPPFLVETARVTSAPAHRADALEQKKRWEHGFLDTLRHTALPTLARGVVRRSRAEFVLGLHLLVPPLALLGMIAGVSLLGLLGLADLGAGMGPVLTVAAALLGALLLVAACWFAGGRAYVSGGAALRAPLYALWKLPIYLAFLRGPSTRWTRTPRR
ncbi:glycosyltransferase family 2 protein [Tsuneonella sp. HG249]